MVDVEAIEAINFHLNRLEEKHQITILYACEVGSRNWDLHSEESDYDIRYVYIHRNLKSYLSMESRSKSIETEMVGHFDLFGFELQHFLGLIHRCNPSGIEWVESHIHYRNMRGIRERFKGIVDRLQTNKSLVYYYRRMIELNLKSFFTGVSQPIQKKYFYLARPALLIQYLMTHEKPCYPESFQVLLDMTFPEKGEIYDEISALIVAKKLDGLKEPGEKRKKLEDWATRIMNMVDYEEVTLPARETGEYLFYEFKKLVKGILRNKKREIPRKNLTKALYLAVELHSLVHEYVPSMKELPREWAGYQEFLMRDKRVPLLQIDDLMGQTRPLVTLTREMEEFLLLASSYGDEIKKHGEKHRTAKAELKKSLREERGKMVSIEELDTLFFEYLQHYCIKKLIP